MKDMTSHVFSVEEMMHHLRKAAGKVWIDHVRLYEVKASGK